MGIMGIMGISHIHLLVIISVLCLERAQTTTVTPQQTSQSVTSTTTSTTPSSLQWQAPEMFYPFGSAVGDIHSLVPDNENFTLVTLSSPFQYFGRQYHLIYVNNNGLLSLSREIPEANPFPFPYGLEDLIAPLWTELDDYGLGAYYYQEYTSGDVLTRATQDINRYYPGLSFSASWVFVATWDFVQTWDTNVFSNHSAPSISVQVVLISDGSRSFILMNYGDVDVINFPVEAGYDTIGSTHYFVIPDSTDGNLIPNLKYSSNVNVQGRWAFSANQGIVQFRETFYPVGLAAGDKQTLVAETESFDWVTLSSPFQYFGRHYHLIYVNNNGLLSLSREIPEANPFPFPYGLEDLIAPLWTELDDYGLGAYYYHEYTSGEVLTRATQDINRYYPGLSFSASWVFVATWDFVQTWDGNVFSNHSAPSISVQVVLISDGSRSFILMNYGDINVIGFQVEAGYDTIGSTHYFVIPDSTDGNLIPNLKYSSNVNVQGRWAFSANQGIVQFTENFYPVGLTAGDTQLFVFAAESVVEVSLSRPFLYFGRSYNMIYVNNNGLLSFSQPIAEMEPLSFSSYGEDLIAPLWTDLDDFGFGIVYYQEYTSGNVLTRATEDIKSYYPGLSFNANWVFVATWDFVQTWDESGFYQHAAPIISFQVVLISDGSHSFILMNYGDISVFGREAEAGYGTIGSTHYFVIPGSNDLNLVPNLKHTSNVHVPGRWAFMAYPENVVGLQMTVTSYLDLIEGGNLAFVLEQIKHELVIRGLSSDVQLSARRVKKTP
ncbi:uncharacterized protein LOC130438790 [Triplophysa dalaica]|uniref:uncharacterized protein LOC130438790 n=1 Tax=Triplophysa dalaica TaxID=1582913 RepID=UPI0024E0363F|nr:uncharacterized protein LOC130438790 [Triplophysa dalaica]